MEKAESRKQKQKEANERYRKKHPDRIKARREARKEAQKEYAKQYRLRPEVRERERHRKRKDCDKRRALDAASARRRRAASPKARIDHRISASIGYCVKAKSGGRSWRETIGYTVDDLLSHLEKQFLPGMSWSNIGLWEIDHIVPSSSFHYETVDSEEFRSCWALSNLRPMWREDNRKKKDKRTHLL